MSQKVTITRQRTIEEKAEATVEAADPADAVAAAKHLVSGNCIGWRYHRTIETSDESVEVKEVTKNTKSK